MEINSTNCKKSIPLTLLSVKMLQKEILDFVKILGK